MCTQHCLRVSPVILLGELKLYYVVLAHPKMWLIWSHRRWISSLAFQKYWLTKASRPCGTTTEVGDAKEGNFHCICGDRESKVGSALIAGRVTKTCPFASLQHWSNLLVYVVLLGLSHAILMEFTWIHLDVQGAHEGFIMDSLPGLNMVKPVFGDWFPKWMAQPLPSQQVLHAHADTRI